MPRIPHSDFGRLPLSNLTRLPLGFFVGAALIGLPLSAAEPASRPNIVFIQTDDQGPWALGFSGHPQCKTPHLDRLAKEGAYLPNCFTVTPVCSPSRAELMTSRYGTEVGITEWINPKSDGTLGLDAKWPVWPKLLQNSGYKTGLFGKWHLGSLPEQHPRQRGYGEFYGFLGGGVSPKDPKFEVGGTERKESGFAADLITTEAVKFISARKAEPFQLSLHFREPHAPYLPTPESDWEAFRDLESETFKPEHPDLKVQEAKQKLKEYFACVASLDRNVGRVLAALDEHGLAEKTYVIFISDHGYNMGQHGVWHKGNGHWLVNTPPPATDNIPKGQRPNLFDTSLRVPCLVRRPGTIPAGSRMTRTVSNLDWFPTILAMTGTELPAGVEIRGRNALPLLQGKSVDWNDDLYVEYSTRHQSKTHMRAYRTPEWKLIRDFLNPGRDELFRLATDPGEEVNLIASTDPAAVAARKELDAKLLAELRKLHDPLVPEPAPLP